MTEQLGREMGGSDALALQNDTLRQTIAVVDRLTAMALEGGGIEQIAEELARSIGAQVEVFDELFRPLVARGPDRAVGPVIAPLDDPRVREIVDTVRQKRLPIRLRAFPNWVVQRDCVVAPIASGERVLGFLVATTGANGSDEDLQLMTIQHATSICALAVVQRERDEELRLRYRAEFVESLLTSAADASRAAELARLAGIDADVAYTAFAVGPLDPASGYAPLFNRLALELQQLGGAFATTARADHVLVLAPVGDTTRAIEIGGRIAEFLQRGFPTLGLVVGSSQLVVEPTNFQVADIQARRALQVARRLGSVGEVTPHDRVGIHGLLLHVPIEELGAFARETLGGLLSSSTADDNPLLATLAVYLHHNANLRRTAQELLVHPNTVTYRLHRVEALTGLSLRDAHDRLLAEVAVEALRVLP